VQAADREEDQDHNGRFDQHMRPAKGTTNLMETMSAFLEKAGPIGALIIGCSVIAFYIVIERWWTFRKIRLNDPQAPAQIRRMASQGSFQEAIAFCRRESHPLTATLARALIRMDKTGANSRGELEKTLSRAASKQVRSLEWSLPTLHLISSITPLLGLLGTVVGMIRAFQTIQHLGGKVNATVLAGGIWEAMLTTALGLSVAIPVLVAHNLLEGKVHDVAALLKEEGGAFLESLQDAGYLVSAAGAPPDATQVHADTREEP
jgi:biopolymer transport protein ExbB